MFTVSQDKVSYSYNKLTKRKRDANTSKALLLLKPIMFILYQLFQNSAGLFQCTLVITVRLAALHFQILFTRINFTAININLYIEFD